MNKLDKIYHDMDIVVSKLLKEVLDSIEKQDKIVVFEGFDIKNKSHLLILNMLYIARSLTKKPIKIKASRWTIYRINKLYKKNFDKVLIASMDIIDLYGDMTNSNVCDTIDKLNEIYYNFYE